MKTEALKKIVEECKEQELIVILFTQDEAEQLLERELTKKEWTELVESVEGDKHLQQQADECFSFMAHEL